MDIIIVNGAAGSGKTTFENLVKNIVPKKVFVYSIINPVKELARRVGWNGEKTNKDRKFLCDFKQILDEWKNFPIKETENKIKVAEECGYELMFIDMREQKDIEYFKEKYNAKTLFIKRQGIEPNISNYADLQTKDNEAYKYNFVIYNNGTIDDLKATAYNFYQGTIQHTNVIT